MPDLLVSELPRTWFIDLDGTLFMYADTIEDVATKPQTPCPYTLEKMNGWWERGDHIVLVSARYETLREKTEADLKEHGVPYSHLIMGLGNGERHLVNDLKPNRAGNTAFAHNLVRDEGFGKLDD